MSLFRARTLRQDQLPTARRTLCRTAPGPLREALDIIGENLDTGRQATLLEEIHVFTAAGVAMARVLADEQRQTGRRVQLTIYGLHRLLGGPDSQGELSPEAARTLKPWSKWLGECARSRTSRWPVLMRWVDIFSERLTMNRYGDHRRRALHAKGLLAAPLLLLLSEAAGGAPLAPEKTHALEDFCEALLGVWDLIFAAEDAAIGWNRVEMPRADQLGGFYALSDTAQPPDDKALRQAAMELGERLRTAPVLDCPLDGALAALGERARQRLDDFLERGVWPEHYLRQPCPAGSGQGWLGRIAERMHHLRGPNPCL